MKEILVGLLVVIILGGLCVVGKGISVYNTSVDFTTKIEAKQKANEADFDAMWKKISQVSQVSDKYKDGLKEVLASYTNGRKKESDQLLMDWTKEAIPTFDSSIYKQINNVITSSRDDFANSQKVLIDIQRQYNNFIRKFPNNIYCSILNIKEVEIKVVTSSKTENAFNTGKEDDVKLQ